MGRNLFMAENRKDRMQTQETWRNSLRHSSGPGDREESTLLQPDPTPSPGLAQGFRPWTLEILLTSKPPEPT